MYSRMVRLGLSRDARATTYLVGFVITAVATVLLTRGILAAAGYPQLGGSGLHVAHVLWGGLLMALSLMLVLSFVGPVVRPFAAFVGGVGFGLFIDEVGKFVTSTTDYFFKPALAIMYATVVLLVLLIHWVHGRRAVAPVEYLANALSEAAAGAGGMRRTRRRRAYASAYRATEIPGSDEAVALIRKLPEDRSQLGDPMTWIGDRFRQVGSKIVHNKIARRLTIGLLVLSCAGNLLTALIIIIVRVFAPAGLTSVDFNSVPTIGATISSLISAICIVLGLRLLRRDRRAAYAWFERAVLISLLVTDVFVVANDEFSALPSTAVDLFMLAVLGSARAALEREAEEMPEPVSIPETTAA